MHRCGHNGGELGGGLLHKLGPCGTVLMLGSGFGNWLFCYTDTHVVQRQADRVRTWSEASLGCEYLLNNTCFGG